MSKKTIGNLPGPAKLVVVLLIVIGMMALLWWAFTANWKVGVALVVGLVVLLVLILVVGAVLGAMGKSKGKPFEQELASNAGAAPAGVSEAASRARLDDLRRRFEEGVEIFRRHGKDVYSLPWYMIVGEPGSGKTEVIRHSDIGFPPGLQDELQGSGGTINMDWWFTNNAIILDTAGRLLFDEVGGTATSEWKEFLKLLGKHRPNCPINGLMLVLPADSLIKDSPEEIEAKGARIARQLDLIQRTLDVRFPVFILITKADLVNGFREFFDELDDPQLEHQILGWSNQGELDDPFFPEDVAEHFLAIKDRLVRRRGGLLLDPVGREGENRLDEIDAMYTFPESVEQLVPRLKKYLEMIFAQGEWATKPLFLRGIYFVSSMREGSALDQDLAEAMGVPLDTLPEGRLWERDRSYFLRDLFLEKMFRERGLVTRATDTNQLLRKRKRSMYVFSGVTLVFLLLFTIWQASSLRASIREPMKFWNAVERAYSGDPASQTYPVIIGGLDTLTEHKDLVYLGQSPAGSGNDRLRMGGGDVRVAEVPGVVGGQVVREIRVPFIFKPATWFSSATAGGNLHVVRRQQAAEAILTNSVLDPLVRRAVIEINASNRVGPVEGPVLVQLLRMYEAEDSANPQLDPLFAYVLRPEMTNKNDDSAYLESRSDVASIQSGFDTVFTSRRNKDWPRSVLSMSSSDTLAMLESAVSRYSTGAAKQFGEGAEDVDSLGRARRLEVAMRNFRSAEQSLIASYGVKGQEHLKLTVWETAVPEIIRASTEIRKYSADMGGAAFAEWFLGVVKSSRVAYLADIDAMLATLPAPTTADETATGDLGDRGKLLAMRQSLEKAKVEIETAVTGLDGRRSDLQALGRDLFEPTTSSALSYLVRSSMYSQAENLRQYSVELSKFVQLPEELFGIDTRIGIMLDDNNRQITRVPGSPVDGGVFATATALERIRDMHAEDLFDQAKELHDRPLTQPEIESRVTELASGPLFETEVLPAISMTSLDGVVAADSRYHSRSGPAIVESLAGIEKLLVQGRQNDLALKYREVRVRYAAEYLRYWADLIDESGGIQSGEDWAAFHSSLADLQWRVVSGGLLELNQLRHEAITRLDVNDLSLWEVSLVKSHTDAVGAIRNQTAQIEKEAKIGGGFELWIESWRELGPSFATARVSLLDLDLTEYNNRFGHLCDQEGVAGDFWTQMTVSAILALKEEGRQITETGLERLAEIRRFPLIPLADSVNLSELRTSGGAGDERVMSAEELIEAYDIIQMILPESESRASVDAPSFGPGRLGNPNTQTGHAEIDAALRYIRGSRIPRETVNELRGVRRVLAGLSENPLRPFRCTIEVLGTRPHSPNLAQATDRFPNVKLNTISSTGMTTSGNEVRQQVALVQLGLVEYPGDSIEFEFIYSEGAQQKSVKQMISGPWAPIALIHRFNGVRSETKPNEWEIEYTFKDGAVPYSVWMRYTFDAVLQELEDWGSP